MTTRWDDAGSGGPPDPAVLLERAIEIVMRVFPGAVPAGGDGPHPVLALPSAEGARDRFLEVHRRVAPLGWLPMLRAQAGRPVLILVPKPPPGRWAWQTNLLLVLATMAATFYAGYEQSRSLVALGFLDSAVAGGIAYSASVLLILGAHEMGHKLVALRRGIDASLPYFLPMIPPFGTMGAVIVTRTPAPNRDSLMDLGASGPIAGFIAALPVLVYGVTHSFLIDASRAAEFNAIPDPLLIRGLIRLLLDPPPTMAVLGHPALFAGWLGLVVTSINLLPASMLDGGHAVRAALGPKAHALLSYLGVGLAAAMGFYPMAILIALMLRRGHPGPLDDLSPLSPSRRVVAVALIAVFAASAVVLQPLFGF
ncbi:MAG: site-2 protease family protein [Armatimonadota bacterium]|nr:site-2 protease family protein [Armatimonadota bacterium]MDR7511603.1 site-2 protease family protein [Armatimonadota bacterium]